jgi:nicotinamide-nucleotide amidase
MCELGMIQTSAILSTGDELTTGKVVDTNSAVIADRLFALGVTVAAVLKVGDDREKLLWSFRQARELADVIIGTGGLGPTADDLTTELVAEFLGVKLVENKTVADGLKKRFEARGIAWTENNLKQALFPEGAVIIPNPLGTAPGFRVSLERGKNLIWLSGVPQEMAAMLNETVIPWLAGERGKGHGILACAFKVHGLTESKLDDLVKPLDLGKHAKLSFRAHFPDLTLRLTVDGDLNQQRFVDLCAQIRHVLGPHIYAEGDITMEERVGQLLLEKNQTLSLAESCTGGLISHRITRVAGSSAYYLGGATTYSNEAKVKFLGVKPATLDQYGAVSEQTALEMSHGIREKMAASVGLSVTGVAGPSGGSPENPVGTVWISVATGNRHEALRWHFHGDRERVMLGASQAGLNWLRLVLLEQS